MSIAWIHSRVESCSSTSAATVTLISEDEAARRAKRRAVGAQHSVEGKNHHAQNVEEKLSRRSWSVQINARSNLRHRGEKGVFFLQVCLRVTTPEINLWDSFHVDLHTRCSQSFWLVSRSSSDRVGAVWFHWSSHKMSPNFDSFQPKFRLSLHSNVTTFGLDLDSKLWHIWIEYELQIWIHSSNQNLTKFRLGFDPKLGQSMDLIFTLLDSNLPNFDSKLGKNVDSGFTTFQLGLG